MMIYIILGALGMILVGVIVVSLLLFKKGVVRAAVCEETYSNISSQSDSLYLKKSILWALAQKYEELEIRAKDDILLRAKRLKSPNYNNRVVICFHGIYSSGLCAFGAGVRFYYDNGFDVVLVDLRAHGKSEGKYIGYGILDRFDCQYWCEYIHRLYNGKADIYLHGISMGCATVLMASGLSLPKSVRGIIGDCGYTEVWRQMAHVLITIMKLAPFPCVHIGSILCKIKAGYGFFDANTLEAVRKTKIPILFIHGEKDTFIPPQDTYDNYHACVSKKYLYIAKGAGHARSYEADPNLYQEKIMQFVKECGG